jgi:hypothetical protein
LNAKVSARNSTAPTQMDYKEPNVKRSKKSDKAKKTHEKYGATSQKHIRITEAVKAKKT